MVGSPVSSSSLQPYCGAFGLLQLCAVLLLKGSTAHSVISWLRPLMSLLIQARGPVKPGVSDEDQMKVWTGWLPLPLMGPFPLPVAGPAPSPPRTQQFIGSLPRNSTTPVAREIASLVVSR